MRNLVALIKHMNGLTFVREYAGPNAGEGVVHFQKTTGNAPPDSWCQSYIHTAGTDIFGKHWPLRKSGSCEETRQSAIAQQRLVTDRSQIKAGWCGWTVSKVQNKAGQTIDHAHHTFLLIKVLTDGFVTNEGNAADPSGEQSSNGNGAYKGRVRGNKSTVVFNGITFRPDSRTYHFGNLSDLDALDLDNEG